MFDLKDGIDTLTRFKRETPAFIERLKASGEPIVLTVNGRAEVVVQDAGAYQEMKRLAAKAAYEAEVTAINEGLEEMKAGRGRSLDDALKDLRTRLGIKGKKLN